MTTLPPHVKICHLLREENGVTTLANKRVKLSPQHNKKKMGLDVGKSQKWPCQHLGLFKFEFCTEKKLVQENTDDDILTKRYFPGAYHIQKREENGYTGLIVVKSQ